MKTPLLSIVIPCLNEKQTIRRCVKDAEVNAKRFFNNMYEIVIADNGSSDGTLEVLSKLEDIRIVHVPVRGYGAALHWGIMKSKGKYVIFADADLSYPFSNLSKFVESIKNDPDMVLGSRLKGNIEDDAMPWMHRYIGTPVLTLLIRLIYKINVSDCNSGMRMIKRSFYKKLNMRNSGMEWASELLLKTALEEGKYEEVPIRFLKDKRESNPHLSTWADGWRHLKAIMLMKPTSIYPIVVSSMILAAATYSFSFAASFLFLIFSFVLILSLVTLDLLYSALNSVDTRISRYIKKFEIVPAVILFAIVVLITTVVIPDERLGTKLFLASVLGITFMWIFLVETIKTHLVNRLPDIK